MQARRKAIKSQRTFRCGAALVEMALVLPIFMSVTLGIIEFGRAMMVGQLVTNAAREGARLAVIDGSTNASVEASIKDFLQQSAGTAPQDVSVTISIAAATGNPNPGNNLTSSHAKDLVTVKVEVPFTKISFVSGNYLEGKKLIGQSAMRHE